MFFIIWGSRNRISDKGHGEFFCPNCGKKHPYVHKQAKRWFTLYFIPVFPIQDLGEFIECTVCNMVFQMEVLQFKPKRAVPPVADQLNGLRERLEQGESIEYAIRDLTVAGLDRQIAQSAVKGITGDTVKACSVCGLTYAPNVTACRECSGGVLVTKTVPA